MELGFGCVLGCLHYYDVMYATWMIMMRREFGFNLLSLQKCATILIDFILPTYVMCSLVYSKDVLLKMALKSNG